MGELIELSQEILVAGEKIDQELIDQGAELISRQSRNARDLGNWFNRVKIRPGDTGDHRYTSAASLIAEANAKSDEGADVLSYSTAQDYGSIVDSFPTTARQRGMAFTTCRRLLPVIKKIGVEAFDEWHYKVSVGICPETDPNPDYNYASTNGKPLIGKDLKRQIDIATDTLKLVESDKVTEVTTYSVANLDPIFKALGLPKTAENKLRDGFAREVKRIEKEIHGHFIDEVNAAADTIAEQRTAELREKADTQRLASIEARKKYEKSMEVLDARERRLPKFMDKKEFKLIQGCLHSDRIPEDMRIRFDRAFEIFNRLAEGGEW